METTLDGDRIERLRQWTRELFNRRLTPAHQYHDWRHTADVGTVAERIIGQEGIGAVERELLLAAVLLHDTGFTERYQDNETVAVEICRRVLPALGYSAEQVVRIGKLILATRLPQRPTTQLESAFCDADLDYLGRENYFELSERLRREWAAFGQSLGDAAWLERQIDFLSRHDYFLASMRALRGPGKAANLATLRRMVHNHPNSQQT